MSTQISPYRAAAAVTPSDATSIPGTTGLYVGTTGNLAVTTVNGDVVTFIGVPAGFQIRICVTKVMATNTTASTILALYD